MFDPIPVDDFLQRTQINPNRDLEHSWSSVKQIVSLRQLERVEAVNLMHTEYLEKLLLHARLAGGNKMRVYEGCKIHLISTSPNAVLIGQRFIERRKYRELLENFNSKFEQFAVTAGLANLNAMLVLGRLKDGTYAVAQYLPAIVEMNGTSKWHLLDGLHRNFLIQRIGGVTPIIGIEGVKAAFPCSLHDWKKIKPVDEKPPVGERYFDLKEELFRDLKYVGIDG